MSQFQYRIVRLFGAPTDDNPDKTALSIEQELNKIADLGWRLIFVSGTFHYFERELQ